MSGNGITLTFTKAADWDAGHGNRGFTANVTIINETGQAIDPWELQFDFLFTITQMWNASYSQDGERFTITPEPWNAQLQNGQSRSFGFNGMYSEVFQEPTAYVLSGIPVGAQNPAQPINPLCMLDTSFIVTSNWQNGDGTNGFVAEMYLTNIGIHPVNWQLTFDFGAQIGHMWNASYHQEANRYTVMPDSWNVRLEPGRTRSFGFVGTYSSTLETPQNIVCNGDNGSGPGDGGNGTFNAEVTAGFSNLLFTNQAQGALNLTATNPTWNPANHTFSADVTLSHTATTPLTGVRAILSGFTPASVSVVNPSGYTSLGESFIAFGDLGANESTTLSWRFYSPEDKPFTFTVTLIETTGGFALSAVTPTSFPNDSATSVTVNGTGIRAETAFFIQSTQLAVTNWSETQATVVVPAGFAPATYGLMAVNPDGSRATLYPALTITEGAAPQPLEPKNYPGSFVEGFVIDYVTQEPIAGASVGVPGLETMTGPTGYYLLRGLPPGRHAVRIEAQGYEPVYRFAEVTGEQQIVALRHAGLEPQDPNVTMIGPEGGTHYASNGAFLVIPPDALDGTVPIQFTHTRAAETLPELPEDGYYLAFAKLRPTGLTFNKPATLYLPLQEGAVIEPGTPIRISYFDEKDKRWVQDITSGVISEIDSQLYLEYEINHFTWIGGQWAFINISGCVEYEDGSPAWGVSTNFGTTDANGNVTGTAPNTNRTWSAFALAHPQAKVTGTLFNNTVFFPCIVLPLPEPSFSEPLIETDDNAICDTGGYGYLNMNSQSQNITTTVNRRLLLADEVLSIQANIPQFSVSGLDPTRLRFYLGDQDVTSQVDITYPVTFYDWWQNRNVTVDRLDAVLFLDQPMPTGAGLRIGLAGETRAGQEVDGTTQLDVIHELRAAQINLVQLFDDDDSLLPVDFEELENTPVVVFSGGYLNIIYRPGDPIDNLEVLVPLVALNEAEEIMNINLPDLSFDDSLWGQSYSGSAPMTNGLALVPVNLTIPNPDAFTLRVRQVFLQRSNQEIGIMADPVTVTLGVGALAAAVTGYCAVADCAPGLGYWLEDMLFTLQRLIPAPQPVFDPNVCYEAILCTTAEVIAPPQIGAITIVRPTTAECTPQPDFTSGNTPQPDRTNRSDPRDPNRANNAQNAIDERWLVEADFICRFDQGTVRWSETQLRVLQEAGEIWKGGNGSKTAALQKLRDGGLMGARGSHVGHHINSVQCFEGYAGSVENIVLTPKSGHMAQCHGGSYNNCAQGELFKSMDEIAEILLQENQGIDNGCR